MVGRAGPAFRIEDPDQCWPLLFHVEPLLTASGMGEYSVTVLDEQGPREFPDVATAQAGSRQRPPLRVELSVRGGGVKMFSLWMVGFGPDQEAAVTVAEIPGMHSQTEELRASIAEFLDEAGPATTPPTTTPPALSGGPRGWRWVVNQPWTVQVVGGIVATLVAAGIITLITILFR